MRDFMKILKFLACIYFPPLLIYYGVKKYYAYKYPESLKRKAGIEAEEDVKERLNFYRELNINAFGKTELLHGQVFVFNDGKSNEFSVEVDHIVVTRRHIFLIETKYKSGTIHVIADASTWATASASGHDGSMRNALLQVKNTARILLRELKLPVSPIPIVAIYGNDVEIVGGVTNVVVTKELIDTIKRFDASEINAGQLNPSELANLFVAHADQSPEALDKHVNRIRLSQAKEEERKFINSSSIQL